jgi:hypothetical protein
MLPDEITFLRKHDYRFVRELGAGACGRTVLLHDPEIDEHFVCKKYAPLAALKEFVSLLKSCTKAKKNIVISNLQTKLNSRPRYSQQEEDVPF